MYKLKCLEICGKFYGLIYSFFSDRHERVVLNGHSSHWSHIIAGVPHVSILGPLLFLLFISYLPESLASVNKQFADDTSIFSVMHDPETTSISLNENLRKMSKWIHQWKIFSPGTSKETQEIVFALKKVLLMELFTLTIWQLSRRMFKNIWVYFLM